MMKIKTTLLNLIFYIPAAFLLVFFSDDFLKDLCRINVGILISICIALIYFCKISSFSFFAIDIFKNKLLFSSFIGTTWSFFVFLAALIQIALQTVLANNQLLCFGVIAALIIGNCTGAFFFRKYAGPFGEIGLALFAVIVLSACAIDIAAVNRSALLDSYFEFNHMATFFEIYGVMLLNIIFWSFLIFIQISSFSGYIFNKIGSNKSSMIVILFNAMAINLIPILVLAVKEVLIFEINGHDFLFALKCANIITIISLFFLVPELIVHFIAWILLQIIHNVRYVCVDKIPKGGGAILICNHVSHLDAAMILAACPRKVHFIAALRTYNFPLRGWPFRAANAIPISEGKTIMCKAFDEVAQLLNKGELICIFPEGKLTKNGDIDKFKYGVIKILGRTPVPIIPIAVRGLWGSFLTNGQGIWFIHGIKKGLRSNAELVVGNPIYSKDITAEELRAEILRLRADWL